MKYERIRTIVLEAVHEAVAQGLVKGTSGNIAMRDDEDDVLAITPSGVPYDGMTPEDISIVTLDGEWIDGPYKPSSEVPMHTAVMRARPDIKATVHTHAMFATIMAMGEDPILRPITPPHCEFTPVHVVPYALPGSQEIADGVVNALGTDGLAVLMKNHGMFCCGKSMKAAMEATAYVEEMAVTTYYARLLGNYEPMSAEDEARTKILMSTYGVV